MEIIHNQFYSMLKHLASFAKTDIMVYKLQGKKDNSVPVSEYS